MEIFHQKNQQGGYIALMSVIIICLILLAITSVLSMSSYFSRFNVSDKEYKRISLGLAESCANVALLNIAQNPNYAGDEIIPVGANNCNIKPVSYTDYDANYQKIATIATFANLNGAFSNMEVSATVQDPNNAPPAKAALIVIVQTVNSYGGTTQPDSFTVDVTNSSNPSLFPGEGGDGTRILINPGWFDVNETMVPANYTSSFLNSGYPYLCSGWASVNKSYVCVITNTELPTTFSLTAVANITRAYQIEPVPNNLQLSLNGPVNQSLISGAPQSDLPAGSYTVSLSGVPNGYTVSTWGQDCLSGGGVTWAPGEKRYKTCSINIVENPPAAPTRAALTVVTRVMNTNGGTAQPSDFNVNISAINPTRTTFSGVGGNGTTTLIDPGAFNVTQTSIANYSSSSLNTVYPYLCHGNAIAGQSYLCVITNTDIATTFTLTASVNITRAWGIAPVPNFTLALDGTAGHKILTSGVAQSGLPQGYYSVSISGVPSTYSVSQWGSYPDCLPTGEVSWVQGEKRYKTCVINIVENPPPFKDIDTVLMLDRTGSMFNRPSYTYIAAERKAAEAFLELFDDLSAPKPQVGIGVFASDSGKSAKIAGFLTSNYKNNNRLLFDTGTNLAQKSGTNSLYGLGGQNQWTNPDNGRNIDNTFATDSTYGHQQDYSNFNFNFNIPTSAVIKGIEVLVDGKVSSASTATLYPNGQGQYTAWTNGESTIDETGNPSCSSSDSISESTAGDRESVNLDLSSISDGSLITSVQIFVWDVASGNTGGTYQTFVRNGTDTDSGINLTTTSTSGCTQRNQTIDIADFIKNSSIDLEVGVLKTSTNNNTVRVGAIRSVVTYIPSAAISIALSSNNGSSWTSPKNVNLTTTEASYTPTGNNPTDLWGRTWVADDFKNGSSRLWGSTGFALRLQNNSETGITTSVNYITIKVNYETINNLYTAITTELANSYGGTDLSAAISMGNNELNGPRHIASHKKYLILLSDGEPTYPGNGQDITQGSIDAALSSATTAKNSGTEIYTIHFGNVSNLPAPYNNETSRDLIALLATNSDNDKSTIAQENDDDDHFFIIEATADPTTEMTKIFNKIGQQIINAETPPSATTGTLNVVTHVINSNNGTSTASDFKVTVSGINPIQTFDGVELPGKSIILNPGAYSVAETAITGYIKNIDSQCSGNIVAGQEITCTIINDDAVPSAPPLPPPPPGPPLAPPSATTSVIYIITHMINDNGKSKNASDFSTTVTGDNPVPSAFFGQEYPGVEIILNPGIYSVTEQVDSDYVETLEQGCRGTLIAGQAVACTIINDDTPSPVPPPPLPPPPPPNIIIDTWMEIGSWTEAP